MHIWKSLWALLAVIPLERTHARAQHAEGRAVGRTDATSTGCAKLAGCRAPTENAPNMGQRGRRASREGRLNWRGAGGVLQAAMASKELCEVVKGPRWAAPQPLRHVDT